ncbi:MAG: ABC transporter substrate-binding protein [Pseudomonadota bacterium]
MGTFWKLAVAAIAGATLAGGTAGAQSVKLAVNTDMSGMQSTLTGASAVHAVNMAVEDFGKTVLGKPIEVVVGDNQTKADLAVSLSRRWYENENVDAIFGINLTPAAVQIAHLAERFNKVAMISDAGSTRLVQQDCTPNHVLWGWNTYAYAALAVKSMLAQGKKTFFFILVDYAYGHDMLKDATRLIEAGGGSVVGSAAHPIGATDYATYLLKAQNSKADAIFVVSFSLDTMAAVKQAAEFGIMKKQVVIPAVFTLQDIDTLGLEVTQGLNVPVSFFWDRNDATRDFAARFEKRAGKKPNYFIAQDYSATLNYLRAVQKAGTTDGRAVVKALKEMKIDDMFASHDAYVRVDGQLIHDMYLTQVKTPKESHGKWDYEKLVATQPGNDVYQPVDDSCKLVKKP